MVVRHEDLSKEPVPGFRSLFQRLGMPYSSAAHRAVIRATTGRSKERGWSWQVSSAGVAKTAYRPLDARENVTKWKRRLSAAEVREINERTADVATHFYSDEDW